jgi:hypothetical protein
MVQVFRRNRYVCIQSSCKNGTDYCFFSDSRTNGSKEQQATREPRLDRPVHTSTFPNNKRPRRINQAS